eukprot:jgi/Undpi1/6781/HiC_scaffold_21.g09258.m1
MSSGNGAGGVEMDLQALVMGSESLLSHIARPDGIPRLTKSLAEIERGSLRMGAEASARSRREALSLGITAEVAEQKQELKGGSMLARNRFDPEALVRVVNAVQLRVGFQPLQPLGETDIEGYLGHHHDMIVATAIDETRRAAEDRSLVRQREWEVDSWRQTKKALMGESTSEGWSASDVPRGASQSAPGAASDEAGRLHPTNPRPEQSLAVYETPSEGVVPPVSDKPAAPPVASRLTALEAGHAAVIRNLNDTDDKFPLASNLAASAGNVVLPGVKNGPEFAYYNAWKILRAMLEAEGWEARGDSTPRSRLDGTLAFLQNQFQELMEDKVKKAREAGTVDASSRGDTATGLPPKVRTFMRLDRQGKFTGEGGPILEGLPVWPQMYLCLRCGGREDAADVALAASASPQNASCNAQEMELLEKVASELREPGKGGEEVVPFIQQMFHSMGDGEDMFKLSVLNVLARVNDKKITRINKETIEDYMWLKLSFVGREVVNSDVLLAAQERVSGRDAMRRFDPDGTNPFAYVNVLLYTQQLEKAVSFLHWKGQHLAALHMALAMNHHNAYVGGDNESIPSYPGDRDEPPPTPSVRELVERCLQGRVDSDPEVCAEYMLLLPLPMAVDCLSSLAVMMGANRAARLLGYVKTNGDRQTGDLDRFLNFDTVGDIAFAAAQKAEDQGRRADAMSFYGLSGDWDQMGALLERALAERLRVGADKRSFWKEIGTTVHKLLLRMISKFDANEARELVTEGVGQMLRLVDFYDLLQKQQLFRALVELERASMLPSSQEEAAGLAARIRLRGKGDAVTTILPEALENGMQCLRHHHLEVKRELRGSAPDRIDVEEWRASREKRLADLENKGRAMVGMAGRLSDLLPASFVADLSRLEANIVN